MCIDKQGKKEQGFKSCKGSRVEVITVCTD
jgi:hypothetical protein